MQSESERTNTISSFPLFFSAPGPGPGVGYNEGAGLDDLDLNMALSGTRLLTRHCRPLDDTAR